MYSTGVRHLYDLQSDPPTPQPISLVPPPGAIHGYDNFIDYIPCAVFNTSTDSSCWRGCGEKGTLGHRGWDCRWLQPLWETVCMGRFPIKLKLERPYDAAIPLLGIDPKKSKAHI